MVLNFPFFFSSVGLNFSLRVSPFFSAKNSADGLLCAGIELSVLPPVALCLESLGFADASEQLERRGNPIHRVHFLRGDGSVVDTIQQPPVVVVVGGARQGEDRRVFPPEIQFRRVDLTRYLESLLRAVTAPRADVIRFEHELTHVAMEEEEVEVEVKVEEVEEEVEVEVEEERPATLRTTTTTPHVNTCPGHGTTCSTCGRVRARVTATFHNGHSFAADILVGADGHRSSVRQLCIDRVPPSYSGACIIYGTIPRRFGVSERDPHTFNVVYTNTCVVHL